jgi:hypothetical protein
MGKTWKFYSRCAHLRGIDEKKKIILKLTYLR